jgi:hypothetical protein
MNAMIRALYVIAILAFVGGCGTIFDSPEAGIPEDSETNSCLAKAEAEVAKAEKAKGIDLDDVARIDHFLTCYVGPASDPGDSLRDHELKLLRGHIVVALLARYGAFNITGEVGDVININFRSYAARHDDARDILDAIEDAELKLRQESSFFPKLPRRPRPPAFLLDVNKAYDSAYKVDRVLTVSDLLKEAATPTYRRTRIFVTSLIAAIGGSVGAAKDAFKDAYNGLRKFAVIGTFGKAYRTDALGYLAVKHPNLKEYAEIAKKYSIKSPTTPASAVGIEDWREWDKLINEACERLAKFSDKRPHCSPES